MDEDALYKKVLKKQFKGEKDKALVDDYLSKLQSVTIEFKVLSQEFVAENSIQRILKVETQKERVVEVCLIS